MLLRAVFLDAGPLGLITQRPGKSADADACRRWATSFPSAGVVLLVPSVADYEVRRELLRARATQGIARLDAFLRLPGVALVSIADADLQQAAFLWANARQAGLPTARPESLDADAVFSAQVLNFGLPPSEFVVATVNVRHIARFVPADVWQNIKL